MNFTRKTQLIERVTLEGEAKDQDQMMHQLINEGFKIKSYLPAKHPDGSDDLTKRVMIGERETECEIVPVANWMHMGVVVGLVILIFTLFIQAVS